MMLFPHLSYRLVEILVETWVGTVWGWRLIRLRFFLGWYFTQMLLLYILLQQLLDIDMCEACLTWVDRSLARIFRVKCLSLVSAEKGCLILIVHNRSLYVLLGIIDSKFLIWSVNLVVCCYEIVDLLVAIKDLLLLDKLVNELGFGRAYEHLAEHSSARWSLKPILLLRKSILNLWWLGYFPL